MTRHRDAADARRRERRRAAHPVQVTAVVGGVRVDVHPSSLGTTNVTLTPTEARALAGVLVAVAADVEARAPADLDAAIRRGAPDAEREPLREENLTAEAGGVEPHTLRCAPGSNGARDHSRL